MLTMMLKEIIAISALLFSNSIATALPDRGTSSCSSIKAPIVPGAKIISIVSQELRNITVLATPPFLLEDVPDINVCDVSVKLTHADSNDTVTVQVWLPLNNWNGRFVATGGSAWAAGLGPLSLAPAVSQGFATTATDAGLTGDPSSPAGWALKPDGTVNTGLLTNFASRSIHDMAVIGKVITKSYYGRAAEYSYWNGCSTGGRQGLVAAQRYPKDFDGILAGAPAIYWPEYVIAEHWPQVVMKEAGTYPSKCELDVFTQAAIGACDELDGVKDGIISDLSQCHFDPMTLIGTKIQCEEGTITSAAVNVVKQIWEGPKTRSGKPLWYGLPLDSPLDSLAGTIIVNGTRVADPFFLSTAWIKYFVKANPDFDVSTIDYASFPALLAESSHKFNSIIGSADPDLSQLRESGKKLLVWHGEGDQLIFPQGTIKYRKEVEKRMGGGMKVDEFFRLFMAPGVDHCGFGSTPGAVPTKPFGVLQSWVEKGKAPEFLTARPIAATGWPGFERKVCKYPLIAKYRGHGDKDVAESYDCVKACPVA